MSRPAIPVLALCGLLSACGTNPPPSMTPQVQPHLDPLCLSPLMAPAWPGDAKCPAPMPAAMDAFDATLAVAGLQRCDVQIPPDVADLSGFPSAAEDPTRLPDYDALHMGPLRLPGWLRQSAAWLDQGLDGGMPVVRALAVASLRRGHALSGCLDLSSYAPALASPQPLGKALAILISAQGSTPDLKALQAAVAQVPAEVQRALVPILAAVDHAYTATQAAWGTQDQDVLSWLSTAPLRLALTGAPLTDQHLRQIRQVQVGAMTDAAAFIALAVQNARLPDLQAARFSPVQVDTPMGKVVIGGGGDDSYDAARLPDGAALLFDLGGDDTYEIDAGAATLDRPVSVLIDVAGQDQYRYATQPSPQDRPPRLPSDEAGRATGTGGGRTLSRTGRQGSGAMGIGMLFDLGQGNDSYRSLALSQGSGMLGVGVLYDQGGDDDYRAEVASQGAAAWGIGLLIDQGGKDSYRSYSFSQGFGYTGGVGALVDGAGDDFYFVDPGDPAVKADPEHPDVGGDPIYLSAQLPMQGNNSMSQGCGFGRRADSLPDMMFLSGGHGLLYDRKGNDRYVASVFAQGCGYYRGIGALFDGDGDDRYEGLWYVQGAAAHVSIGVLIDQAGDDQYDPTFPIRATSIGTANDFSVGLHLDLGGNDSYQAPGLSLGSGYAEGFGILVNTGGTDHFAAAGYPTLGGATISTEFPYTIPRAQVPTIGLFTHVGAGTTYDVPVDNGYTLPAGSNKTWSYAQVARQNPMGHVPKSEKSGGLDQDSGTVVLP